MRRATVVSVLIALVLVTCGAAQTAAPVKIKIRAALFDRDLNLKPVPRLSISFRSLDAPQAAPVLAQTTLDGAAEAELAPGRYQLTTSKPAELFGKVYLWDFEVKITKADQLVELSNDNAKATDLAGARGAHVDELIEQYKRVKDSVVTVWTEDEAGDGVLIDPAGLVLTSHRLVNGHKWIAVHYGENRRVIGEVLVDDARQDAAVLRINLEPLKNAFIPPIALDPGALLEGERVFTIDNNLSKGRSVSTGVVSKADENGINSDVKFTDHGSPLFNSSGTVVGYSRMVDKEFHIVPLSAVRDDIASARKKAAETPAPSARLLPVPPAGKFPTDALIARHESRWEKDLYFFKLGDFDVDLQTPVALYQYKQERYYAAQKERMKKSKGQNQPPLAEPEHKYDPLLVISITPQYKTPFWANMGKPTRDPVIIRPKSSFGRMRLLCGSTEVEPIHPGRWPTGTGGNAYVQVDTNSMEGTYAYHPDAVSPRCGTLTLEVYPSGDDAKVLSKVLDAATVERLWKDFDPYRAAQVKAQPGAQGK